MTSTSPPRLSILFLNYNRLEETRATVDQLAALLGERKDIEVIAVDNGSGDGTPCFLKQHASWMRLLLLDDNVGIGGLNRGFETAEGVYLMVLDDDSHPRDMATIDRLIRYLDTHPKVGVVACRIESADGTPVRSWHLPASDTGGPATAFVGCGFAIRRDLFKRIGWFPEDFFLYQNEIDTAIRVMREGYDIHYLPECRVIHRESAVGRSSWRRVYYPTRNTIWIIRRYFPLPEAVYMIGSRLIFGLLRAIESCQWRCYVKAARDGLGRNIRRERLPEAICRQLIGFKENNSLFYHLKGALRFKF